MVGLLPSWEVVLTSWEAWVGLCLGGHLLPCLRVLFWLLARPAWVPGGLGGLLPSDEGRRALAWEGEEVVPWERLLSSLGGVAPTWRALAWEREEVEPAWGALGLGEGGGIGLGKAAVFPRRGSTSLGSTSLGEGGVGSLGKTAVFPRRGSASTSASLGRSASFPSLTVGLWGGQGSVSFPVGGDLPGKTCCLPQREERPGG